MRSGRTDLKLLDEYRRSFSEAYDAVVGTIRAQLAREPTGRRAKSTAAIIDKLRRESVRLSQIQDIAGCRLIVADVSEQDRIVASLGASFDHVNVVDRRERPSHGYRAVHIVVGVNAEWLKFRCAHACSIGGRNFRRGSRTRPIRP